MKKLLTLLAIVFSSAVMGQNLEVFAGANQSKFYDSDAGGAHIQYSSESHWGYALGIASDSLNGDWSFMRFTLQFEHYGANIENSSSGLGGGYSSVRSINKSVIALGVYPLNFPVFKKMECNIGLELSGLVSESVSGTYRKWVLGQPFDSGVISNDGRYSAAIGLGARIRLAYTIPLNDQFILYPQYTVYAGLLGESYGSVKSFRHFMGFGLKKGIR